MTTIRREMPAPQLDKAEFKRRYRARFYDPGFESMQVEIDRLADIARGAYEDGRKSRRTQPAGEGFADPDYQLSIEWRETSQRVADAQRRQSDPSVAPNILLINGATRSEHTCPGESSKTWRLVSLAREVFARERDVEIQLLDLSRLASEYGRVIYPCKTCVSTAMPLCHWPCFCYPNHELGKVGDWMNEIYPMWAAAHGIMIICPVNWYQAPSSLKLMIDRLVCADGGNPVPNSTGGKDPKRAKELELKGWHYPRHLAGRVFSLVVHGDTAGVGTLSRILSGWLTDMGLIPAGASGVVESYIGYYRPYATSHEDLDKEKDLHEEVRNAARSLVNAVRLLRRGELKLPDASLRDPRQK